MIPFISHEDLGAYLEQTFTGSELMVLIALDGACESVREYLHRDLNIAADDEVTFDGSGTQGLILPERPAHEVSDVMLDGAAVDPSLLYLEGERGVLWLSDGSIWTRGKGNVSLKYTHGYALTEDEVAGTIVRVPANIRLVALRLASAVWRSKGSSTIGAITGEQIGTYRYTQDASSATELASTMLTDDDRLTLEGERAVFAA